MDGWSILAYVFAVVIIAVTIAYTFFDLPGRLSGKHRNQDDHAK